MNHSRAASFSLLSIAGVFVTSGLFFAAANAQSHVTSTVDNAAVLAAHAPERHRVGVPALTISPRMSALASEWARHLCSLARGGRAVLQHRSSPRVGENLFWQGGGDPPSIATAVQSWLDERRFYDPASGQCRGGQCGHYTQLVWRGTTSVGCGTASCGMNHFWVCDYDPPGNWVGQHPY